MRHRKAGVKLGRTGSHRNAMLRNMVTSLLRHDRIRTTDAKAKELRRWVDHVVTLAKRGDLHARRQVLSIVNDKSVVHNLFDKAKDYFGDREGGYTRLIKLGRRAGDAAPITMIELIVPESKKEDKKNKGKEKSPDKKPLAGNNTVPAAEAISAEGAEKKVEVSTPVAGSVDAATEDNATLSAEEHK